MTEYLMRWSHRTLALRRCLVTRARQRERISSKPIKVQECQAGDVFVISVVGSSPIRKQAGRHLPGNDIAYIMVYALNFPS